MSGDIPSSDVSPTEPTPAPVTSSSSTTQGSAVAVAVAMVGRPTPSPDQLLLLLPQPHSSSNSDSTSPHADNDVEISCQPSSNDGTNADADANNSELYVSTPSPFKKQKSALAAGANDAEVKSETKNSSNERKVDAPHLPGNTANESSSDATNSISIAVCAGSPTESNFQGDHLLSESFLQSPDPLLGNNNAGTTDFEFLGQEVMAAASTASAMLSRYDGFDPMPAYSGGRAQTSSPTEPTDDDDDDDGGLGVNLFPQHPVYQDAFPLPDYLQVHLDETHAESTAVAASGYDGSSVTSESPMNGYNPATSAPGTTPPSVSSRSTSKAPSQSKGNKVGSRGKTLEQLAQAKQNATKNANDKTRRPRPLPLRKRKFVMNDSDDDEYQPPPPPPQSTSTSSKLVKKRAALPPFTGNKKRTLVRHNVRADDGDRITCKCSKSKCLKVSCISLC